MGGSWPLVLSASKAAMRSSYGMLTVRAPGLAGVPGRAVERDDLGLHVNECEADVLVGVLPG